MKEPFTQYLKSLGMGDQFIQRIVEIHDECQSLTGQTIDEIFVSEQTVNKERQYRGLYFFTKNTVFKMENFLTPHNIEVGRMGIASRGLFYRSSFDMKEGKATDQSIFQVFVTWEPIPFSINLLASQENCVYLLKFVKKYLMPWIISG